MVENYRKIAPGANTQSRVFALPLAVEDDGSCIYYSECVPEDIFDIWDALADTIVDRSKNVLTTMRTGMLNDDDVAILWTLMLIDRVIRKRGLESLFNCKDYLNLGVVEYSEGVDGINYFDKFLTFAFKYGDEHFTGIESNRRQRIAETNRKSKSRASKNKSYAYINK